MKKAILLGLAIVILLVSGINGKTKSDEAIENCIKHNNDEAYCIKAYYGVY